MLFYTWHLSALLNNHHICLWQYIVGLYIIREFSWYFITEGRIPEEAYAEHLYVIQFDQQVSFSLNQLLCSSAQGSSILSSPYTY